MGSKIGVLTVAAHRVGLTLDEYLDHLINLRKRCILCKLWKSRYDFNIDSTRGDGLSTRCQECQRANHRRLHHKRKENGMAKKKPIPPTPPPAAPERKPFDEGYWDADNVMRAFCQDGTLLPRSEHAPSPGLLSTFRDLSAAGRADMQEYLDGWEDRMAEWKQELDASEGGDS